MELFLGILVGIVIGVGLSKDIIEWLTNMEVIYKEKD